MPDLLDRIRDELAARLEAGRAATQEYERLEAALAALGDAGPQGPDGATQPTAPRTSSTSRRRRATRGAGRRAPRGQNRERVLAAVGDRPGVTAPELAAVSGVKGGTLYTLLRRLVDEGALAKRELPGGDTGYTSGEEK
jgi:hypothetical protein